MYISKKKFKTLEKRIADLERLVKSQQNKDIATLKSRTATIR